MPEPIPNISATLHGRDVTTTELSPWMFHDGAALVDSPVRQTRFDYDESDRMAYVGTAPPGAGTDEPVWVVLKITYTASGKEATILPAIGVAWDDRVAVFL